MRSENCADRPGLSGPAWPLATECSHRASLTSSGGYRSYGGSSSSSSHLFGTDSSSRAASSDSVSHSTTRGGFGSFAHSFTSHFSGGG